MAANRKQTPSFFEEDVFDPVETVARGNTKRIQNANSQGSFEVNKSKTSEVAHRTAHAPTKKKAGFYISADILERFNRKFYELKLAGVAIDNKSSLLELVLSLALDDMDEGEKSRILQRLKN